MGKEKANILKALTEKSHNRQKLIHYKQTPGQQSECEKALEKLKQAFKDYKNIKHTLTKQKGNDKGFRIK